MFSGHSVLNGHKSAIPDFGHFKFPYAYEEIQNLHLDIFAVFCRCASVGRGGGGVHKVISAGFGPGHEKGMLL